MDDIKKNKLSFLIRIAAAAYTVFFATQMLLVGCKSGGSIREDFADLSVKVNVAVEVKLILRTEEVVPDKFFIQDLHSYRLYELNYDERNIFYYEGLPAGNYRVGYWLAAHNISDPVFKATGFADVVVSIPFDRSSNVNVSLGVFRQQCGVSSLDVKPGAVSMSPKALSARPLGACEPLSADRITVRNLTKSVLFARFGAGKAEYYDDNYAILESRLNEVAHYEKDVSDKYIRVIEAEYRQRGLAAALELINGFLADRYSDHLVIKKAELLYGEGDLAACEDVFAQMLEKNPNFPEYFGLKGILAAEAGKSEDAQANLYKAVSLGSSWGLVYDAFARLVFADGNAATAKLLSDYALQKEPNNIQYLQTNLQICGKLGDTKQADKVRRVIDRLTQEDSDAKKQE